MKGKLLWIVVITVAVVLFAWFSKQRVQVSPPTSTAPSPISATLSAEHATTPALTKSAQSVQPIRGQSDVEREKKIWDIGLATPIRFYGIVVDEKGNPVEGAKIRVSLRDHVWEGNTKMEELTDSRGLFSISGHGLGISVMVSKAGYYHLPQSDGAFAYAEGAGNGAPHPDPQNPAKFVLRRMGTPVPLVRLQRDFRVSTNGTSIAVDLSTGRIVTMDDNSVHVEVWINGSEHMRNSNVPFDWRCRISIPRGGLVERTGGFDFEAPEAGYQESDEINMPATLGSAWRSQVSRDFFARLASGLYARIGFTVTAGGEHFFTIESYLNPTPGDRNLEFDPAKQIKVK